MTTTVHLTTDRPAGSSGVDTTIRATAAATVIALAGIAAAISYSHMRLLAEQHGETGWRAHAFPLSVDGIEIVASLVLLADRRAARRSGWLPWTALAAGTIASVAANIAVGGSDTIGRTVAGWPAFALLIAIKLLSGLLEPRPTTTHVADHPPTERNAPARAPSEDAVPATGPEPQTKSQPIPGQRPTVPDRPASPDTTEPDRPARTRTRPAARTQPRPRRSPSPSSTTRPRTNSPDLETAARTAHAHLVGSGQRLTRNTLTRALRRNGHRISNARAGELLTTLRATPKRPINGARSNLATAARQ